MIRVVDASVALKWFLDEEGCEPARALIATGDTLLAPELVLAEAGNAVWKLHRRGDIGAEQAAMIVASLPRALSGLAAMAPLADEALRLAMRLSHPVYDCFYLALAVREDTTLVTADARLLRAVQATPYAARVVPLE